MSTVQEIIDRARQAQGSLAGESVGNSAVTGAAVTPGEPVRSPANEQTLEEAWPFIALDRCGIATHLSASSLTMYHRCREQFRLRYLLGYKSPPVGYLLWGDAHHGTFERNFEQKISSEKDLPVGELKDWFVTRVDELVDEAGGDGEVRWESSSHAKVKDEGVKLVQAYREQAAPGVQPVAVEERFDLFVDEVPVPVIGYIDVVEQARMIDEKTASRKSTVPNGQQAAQFGVYQLAKPLPLHMHLCTKTKTPGVFTPAEEPGLEVPFSAERNARTVRWVQNTVQAILADYHKFGLEGPWPGSHTLAQSPCGWCSFKANDCAWWK